MPRAAKRASERSTVRWHASQKASSPMRLTASAQLPSTRMGGRMPSISLAMTTS